MTDAASSYDAAALTEHIGTRYHARHRAAARARGARREGGDGPCRGSENPGGLGAFIEDVEEHMRLEKDVLFPQFDGRARATEVKRRPGTEVAMIRKTLLPALLAVALAAGAVTAQEPEPEPSWLPSLITETPEEGFALAIVMARRAVTTTQRDTTILHALRPAYSHDPDSLIEVSGVVATYFATIA